MEIYVAVFFVTIDGLKYQCRRIVKAATPEEAKQILIDRNPDYHLERIGFMTATEPMVRRYELTTTDIDDRELHDDGTTGAVSDHATMLIK